MEWSPYVKFLAIGWVGAVILIGLLVNGDRLYSWVGRKVGDERDFMYAKLDLMFVDISSDKLMMYYTV